MLKVKVYTPLLPVSLVDIQVRIIFQFAEITPGMLERLCEEVAISIVMTITIVDVIIGAGSLSQM